MKEDSHLLLLPIDICVFFTNCNQLCTAQGPFSTCPWEGGARHIEYVRTRRYICISSDVFAFHALGIIQSNLYLIQDMSR